MPLKNTKKTPVCFNHPDQLLVLVNDSDPSLFHSIGMAIEKDGTFHLVMKGSGTNLFACPICGYCELYLIPTELKHISEP
ncbi:hypothetical protein H8E88_01205 [candidate division KSB1 bacterium]|nr:hypothetical protein [candidate division KSB1 bacterium]